MIHPRKSRITAILSAMLVASIVAGPASSAGRSPDVSGRDLATMPDSTSISFGGRNVLIAMLRKEHLERLERFARAAEFGAGVRYQRRDVSAGRRLTVSANAVPQLGILSPIAVAKFAKGLMPPLSNESFQTPLPKDAVDFCNAAKATACLYQPLESHKTMRYEANTLVDEDPLMDGAGCTSLGGTIVRDLGSVSINQFCRFVYPLRFTASTDVPFQGNDASVDSQFNYGCEGSADAFPQLKQLRIRLQTHTVWNWGTSEDYTRSCVLRVVVV